MSTIQTTTKTWRKQTGAPALEIFRARPSGSGTTVRFARYSEEVRAVSRDRKPPHPLSLRPQWGDKEYREAYMEAAIDQGVAWQIKINRKFRGLSQKDLAQAIGTQQSAISRAEDPEYGSHRLDTLVQIAKVFDCALSVKFISYSDLAKSAEHLSETDQYATPFDLDIEQCDE